MGSRYVNDTKTIYLGICIPFCCNDYSVRLHPKDILPMDYKYIYYTWKI